MQSYYVHFDNTHVTGSKFLVQWNPVYKDTEGTHHSVCIIQVFILSGLSEKKKHTHRYTKTKNKNCLGHKDGSITPRKSDLLYVVEGKKKKNRNK